MTSNYPPGMPGPRTERGEVRCPNCGHVAAILALTELGTTEWTPEECPECDEPWPIGLELDEYDPADFGPDRREELD